MRCDGMENGCECNDCVDYRMSAYEPERPDPREAQYRDAMEHEYFKYQLAAEFDQRDWSVGELCARGIPWSKSMPALSELVAAGELTGPHLRFGVSRWRLKTRGTGPR